MKGIIVIGHGSRNKEVNKEFIGFVETLKEHLLDDIILKSAFLEFHENTIEKIVEDFIKNNIYTIVVVPYFLFGGKHLSETIPNKLNEISTRYSNLNIKLSDSLGKSPLIKKIILNNIEANI